MEKLDQFKEIVSGWKNLAVKSPKIEKMASERIVQCLNCEKFNTKKRCNLCGCYMPAKVRSEKSKCPMGKW